MKAGTLPSLSVVVPTFNLEATIDLTLDALSRQSLEASAYEIIFVDDGSTDRTPERLTNWSCRAQVTRLLNEGNSGRSTVRNEGWRASAGDVVVFLDGDMLPSPDLLAEYQARFAGGDVDVVAGRRRCLDLSARGQPVARELAGILGRQDGEDLLGSNAASSFARLRDCTSLGQWPGIVQAHFEQQAGLVCARTPGAITRAFSFVTSNVAVTREALEETEGFYPFLARAQDTDMGLQLAERGARFEYLTAADAIHLFDGLARDTSRYRESFQTLMMRHPYSAVALVFHLGRVLAGFAPPPEQPLLRSLAGIARAETEGLLAQVDVCRLMEEDGCYEIPGTFDLTRDGLCAALEHSCHLPPGWMERELDRALSAGLLTRPGVDGRRFSYPLTRMWLEDRSTLREHTYRNSFFRAHWRALAAAEAPRAPLRWHGEYELRIPNRRLRAAARPVVVNLPLPAETAVQRHVAIERWEPPELARHVHGDKIVGFPIEPGEGEVTSIRFAFWCEVSEWRTGFADPDGPEARGQDRWLGPGYDPPTMLRLYEELLRIELPDDIGAWETAHRIHDWMRRFRSRPSPMPDLAVLTCGFGHCAQLARIFVNLCRLAGVPARERSGACASWRDVEDGAAGTAFRRDYFTPFAHTWAEFHAPEAGGWVPVEFLPAGHGANGVTPFNFLDDALRSSFLEDGPLYDEYYFGRLDPFRIYGPPDVNLLPTLAVEADAGWIAAEMDVDLRHDLKLTLAPEAPP